MHGDECCGQDAGIHVTIMKVNEESTQPCLGQAEESIINPEGDEKDEGGIGDCQIYHVDVGVCPVVTFGNEGSQSSSVDEETQKEDWTIKQTLKQFHIAGKVCAIVAHSALFTLAGILCNIWKNES